MELSELEKKSIEELEEIAKILGIEDGYYKRQELVVQILKAVAESTGLIFDQGVLEILPDGWGFLRHSNFAPAAERRLRVAVADQAIRPQDR